MQEGSPYQSPFQLLFPRSSHFPVTGMDHSYHFSDPILLFHLHFQVLETFLHPVMEGPQVVRHPFLMDLNPSSQEGDL